MKLGSLLDSTLGKNISYSYCKTESDIPFNPTNAKEGIELENYTVDKGYLFYKREVSWGRDKLLIGGVDIKISIGEKAYIDHIVFNQGKNSEFKSLEIFTIEDDEYRKIGKYIPQTDKGIKDEEITAKVGYWCDNLVLRFNVNQTNLTIKKLDVYAAWDIEDAVWPLPENMEISKETYSFNSIKTICAKNEDEKFVADFLNEKLDFNFDKTLKISETEGEITFDIKGDGYDDGYTLVSKDGKIAITSTNRRSALYAVEALIQLIDGNKVKCAEISHTAFKPMRGFHTGTPCKDQVGFFKNLIKYVLVPLHYNMLFLEIAGTLEYEKYPEINSTYLEGLEDYKAGKRTPPAHSGMLSHQIWTKSELRELCQFMEEYGVEVVPEVQSFAHVQYITSAYPEMAEIHAPDVEPDKDFAGFNIGDPGPGKFEYHTMCPNHPKYYEVIFNIIDEVLEAVQPKRFVHMGHDEVFPMGVCEICKNIPKDEILTTEVNKLNAYIKQKGYHMMIWGDMLQDQFYHNTSAAVNKIDKDIIIIDFVWYYNVNKDYEDNLLKHGLEVIAGNFYSNGYFRGESRLKKDNMLGGQLSTWVACSEKAIGSQGKFYDLCYTADRLVDFDFNNNYRLTYNEIIKPFIKQIRVKIGDLKSKGTKNVIELDGNVKNIPYDIRGIVNYDSAVKVDYINREENITLNKKADLISFVHTSSDKTIKRPWTVQKIGEYIIEYADGTQTIEEISYSKNIMEYKWAYGNAVPPSQFTHCGYFGTYFAFPISGKTYDGDDYTLLEYVMKNPYPEKEIKNIRVKQSGENGASIIVFEVSVIS